MAEKLKVGIIGTGTIGKVHADAYLETDQAEIAAICDANPNTLVHQGDRLGVTARFSDYRDLLRNDDIEAVSICVGNALHREVAVAALRAGKHVLLEKPMAMNATEAAEIVAARDEAGKVLQIGMMNRQKPEAQLLRQYIENGLLGDIYHMRCVMVRRRGIPGLGGWFTTRSASGGGPMIDIGVHWFDVAMWLSGHWNPTAVSAQTYAKFGPDMKNYRFVHMWAGPPNFDGVFDVEDYSTGMARFADRATMTFEIAWAANAQGESFVEVLGTKGGARLFTSQPLTVYTEHEGHLADIQPQFEAKANIFARQAEKFIGACRGEMPPVATGEQGLAVMKLIDAIYESGTQAREVAID